MMDWICIKLDTSYLFDNNLTSKTVFFIIAPLPHYIHNIKSEPQLENFC